MALLETLAGSFLLLVKVFFRGSIRETCCFGKACSRQPGSRWFEHIENECAGQTKKPENITLGQTVFLMMSSRVYRCMRDLLCPGKGTSVAEI
jgi:hypothetical protein